MKIKIELSDEDKKIAIEEWVRNSLGLKERYYELEEIYSSLGEVTFKVKTMEEIKNEQQSDS